MRHRKRPRRGATRRRDQEITMNRLGFLWLTLALSTSFAWIDTAEAGRRFSTELSGENEIPGPGDEDGSGTAVVTLHPGREQVCFQLSVEDIQLPATGAHIHFGEVDEFGDVAVHLAAPNSFGRASGCVSADRELILDIVRDPSAYYVNVHTGEFPGGAVRGQLSE
jgi:hypothetical protein